MKELIRRIPVLGGLLRRMYWRVTTRDEPKPRFSGSEKYWESRYASGQNSGVGSYGAFASFKAEILNAFVAQMGVRSVIEFGCGDGNQLTLAKYPAYLGFDVSETAVERCRKLFAADPAKKFDLMQRYHGERADLTLSLDVIYHLVEDEVFEHYMRALFDASTRYVVIYSSDSDDNRRHEGPHVRHRRFSRWIRQNRADWRLSAHIPNRFPYKGDCKSGSFADFFIYERG